MCLHWRQPAQITPREWAEILGEDVNEKRKGRRTDRQRVAAARATLAKLPGTVGKLTRAEAAAELPCSIRQIQRHESAGRLKRCPQLGREVTYLARDVRELSLALGKGR
jgi:hypothetical protein